MTDWSRRHTFHPVWIKLPPKVLELSERKRHSAKIPGDQLLFVNTYRKPRERVYKAREMMDMFLKNQSRESSGLIKRYGYLRLQLSHCTALS